MVVSVEVNRYWGFGVVDCCRCQCVGVLKRFLMPLSLGASRLVRQAYLARVLCLCCLGTLEMLVHIWHTHLFPALVGWKSIVVTLIHVK